MLRAPSLDAFLANPIGHFLAGRTWAHGSIDPELFVVMLWGRPNQDDMQALVRSLRVELGGAIHPHRSLVDAARVEGADAAAFAVLHAYVAENHGALSRAVTQLALVRPGGMEGAVVAGFYQVLAPPYPVENFDASERALRWLGQADAPGVAASLDGILRELTGTDPLVGALQALMVGDPVEITIERAAKALGMSERTLQRRLQDVGTTFAGELLSVRIRESQRKMLDTDSPLTSIALDVGFGTLQHFSAIFRRETGLSPSQWRAEHKAQAGA